MTKKYQLEKGSKKHNCPACRQKTFVRFVDTNGNYAADNLGRCDRESKCGYFEFPKAEPKEPLQPVIRFDGKTVSFEFDYNVNIIADIKALPGRKWDAQRKQWLIECESLTDEIKAFAGKHGFEIMDFKPKPPVNVPGEVFKQTLQPERYPANSFINYLIKKGIPKSEIEKVIALYYLGTVIKGDYSGAITFPFIDVKGNINAIQVKNFDQDNHTTATTFLHAIIARHYTSEGKALPEWLAAYFDQDKRIRCLFGEHLLNRYPNNPIALVEAPKTAVYGSLYFGGPGESATNFLWLAVYNKSSFTFDKIKVLEGRKVFVFPDLSKDGATFKEWQTKAQDYQNRLTGTQFIFSDLLERLAPESDRNEGGDLADFLIKLNWNEFKGHELYPAIWDAPPERTTELLYWKLANLLCEVEAAFISKDKDRVSQSINNIWRAGFSEDDDLSEDLLNDYAPSCATFINNHLN